MMRQHFITCLLVAVTCVATSLATECQEEQFCRPSNMPKDDNVDALRTMGDVIKLIEERRATMAATNPLFPTLKNESLPLKQRMLFMPYMLFFSLGCPDVLTFVMRINKPDDQLSPLEQRINTFVREDNFHYNFFIRDFAKMGYDFETFGSPGGLLRHVFAQESISVRMLIYNLVWGLRKIDNPLFGVTSMELLEAGLMDLFVHIHGHITPHAKYLQYFGDKHVELEMQHTVTTWFTEDKSATESYEGEPIPQELKHELYKLVIEMMDKFDDMYHSFNKIILENKPITADKFDISGTPPMDKITEKS